MNTTKNYRVNFILDTRGYEQPVETLIERLKAAITSINGQIAKVENLGQKPFVRVKNRKFPSGIYVQIDFAGSTEAPVALREKLRLDKTVNRMLVQSL